MTPRRFVRRYPHSTAVGRTTRKDEPRIVEFLVENLSADHFSVLTASNGEEALDVLGRTPDLVRLDVVLPDMSAAETAFGLRRLGSAEPPMVPRVRDAATW